MLSLRASNEGLPRPRVARAQEHDRRPRLFESFLLPKCFFQQCLRNVPAGGDCTVSPADSA
jgi:hypothetical protein